MFFSILLKIKFWYRMKRHSYYGPINLDVWGLMSYIICGMNATVEGTFASLAPIYVNKTNNMHSFYIYLYSIICISTLHVSNGRIVHHQQSSLLTAPTALYKIVQTCPAGHVCTTFFFCNLTWISTFLRVLYLWTIECFSIQPITEFRTNPTQIQHEVQ